MKRIIALSLVVGIMAVQPAMAQSNNGAQGCSNKDKSAIKSLNIKAKRQISQYAELVEDMGTYSSKRKIEKWSEDMGKVLDFFKSPQYKAMEPVYARCGVEMPTLPQQELFWPPEDDAE